MNTLRICILISLFLFALGPVRGSTNAWIASWAASPQSGSPNPREALLNIDNQTVRERVRISMGGSQIQLRFSNEFGSSPLVIGSATVAVPTDASSVEQESIRSVTFEGHKSVTIPAGAPVLSDPITFPVIFGAEIGVSIYFPKRLTTPTLHALACKHAVISQHGDFTHEDKIDSSPTCSSSICVTAVLVPAQPSQRLVVAFGDSITDGDGSTVDADNNWPSDLIRRLGKMPEGSKVAVVNEGIVGNRLLNDCFIASAGCFGVSALARFDRDALAMPGVTHVVLLEGVNDISFPGAKLGGSYLADPSDVRAPEDLIEAYRQLISRAHAHGIKLIGVTITPFEGVDIPGYYSESKSATRQAVNNWTTTSG